MLDSCKGTKPALLFRFSPAGDLIAVGASNEKKSYCLSAKGPDVGAAVEISGCTDLPLQKWRAVGNQLAVASGYCASYEKSALKLAECDAKSKA